MYFCKKNYTFSHFLQNQATTLNQNLDTFNYLHVNNPKSKETLLNIMEYFNLVDYFRTLNPHEKLFTWRKANPLKQARLDYFLLSDNLTNFVENIYIKAGYRSDHSSVILELKLNQFKRGKGLWKFNNNLLRDSNFVKKVKETIVSIVKQYALLVYNPENISNIPLDNIQLTIEDHLFLETMLMEIRGTAISYASFKKKERAKTEKNLIEKIDNLEARLTANDDLRNLEDVKLQLENLRKEKLIGSMIRSRAKWVDEGEKPSKYFLNLESRNYTNKTIQRVDLGNGNIIVEQGQILKEIQQFYENLYASHEENIEDKLLTDVLKNSVCNKLTDSQQSSLGDLLQRMKY